MTKRIIVREIEENEEYEVSQRVERYRFQYDFECLGRSTWIVWGWDEGAGDYTDFLDTIDAEYGHIEDAVREFFKLNVYGVYKQFRRGRGYEKPAFTVQAGNYEEAYEQALAHLGYKDLVGGAMVGDVEIEIQKEG